MAKGLTVKIRADASQFEKTMVGVKSKLRSLTPSFTAIAATAAAAGASIVALGYGISRMVKSASQEAANFETLSTQLEVLTGSAANAKKLLDELTTFGATTPLEQGDLQQASKNLLQFGITLDKVMPTLRMLGDVSMGNGQTLQQLSIVFGQVSSAGRLMGGDVLQMINSGFNPLVQISKRTGESMIVLKKRMEDGGISSDEVAQAFKDATSEGGLFNGMLAKIAGTTKGKLSNLSDNIAELKRDFGTGFNEGLKVALDATNEFLPKLQEAFQKTGKIVGSTLADAVSGDLRKMTMIGEIIGSAIGAGMKAATYSAWQDIGNATNRFIESIGEKMPLSMALNAGLKALYGEEAYNKAKSTIQERERNTQKADTQSLVNDILAESMFEIKQNYSALMEAVNQDKPTQREDYNFVMPTTGYRPANQMPKTTLEDILKNIERNTRPTLFPTQ
ncbi:MAG: tape measure protein [Steroidobacteraceae bacterium]